MEGKELILGISKGIPVLSSEYRGEHDVHGLRTKFGDEQWCSEDQQRYKGQFLQDSLHGRGIYTWTTSNKKTAYEGLFYANDLEGYGKCSYNDTSVFEGLFSNNQRFGPGVFTYPDGTQDVGLWNGKNLMRLCCVVNPEWVPRLAKSPMAKIKLLKFKKMIPVCNTTRDRAKDIFEELGVRSDLMEQSSKLYNIHIRNPKSHFFNTALYDQQFFSEKDCYIEVALSREEEESWYKDKASQQKTENINTQLKMEVIHECASIDKRRNRIEEINLELEHTAKVLEKIKEEIKSAKCKMKLAIRTQRRGVCRKSVGWEKVKIYRSSADVEDKLFGVVPQQEVLYEDIDERSDYDECNFEDVDTNIDYKTAYKLVAAAESAEKLLNIKRQDLLKKLDYEVTRPYRIEKETEQAPAKRILISDLLAWNNEDISAEILKHAFLHRNFEKDMSYCVSDLLAGDRSEFRNAGIYEENCIAFLKECSEGNVENAEELLRKHDLNPDISDGKGNTGMVYAATRDRKRIIRSLVNFGANVDILNDESLTPLGICITRFLATQHDVVDWEKAFLKSTLIEDREEKEIREWRPHISICSLSNLVVSPEKSIETLDTLRASRQTSRTKLEAISEIFGSKLEFSNSRLIGSASDIQQKLAKLRVYRDYQTHYFPICDKQTPQLYLLSTDCAKPPAKKKNNKKVKKGKRKKNKTKSSTASKKSDKTSLKSKKSSKSRGSSKSKKSENPSMKSKSSQKSKKSRPKELRLEFVEDDVNMEEKLKQNKLNIIYETIETLLRYGANPNLCEVPLPSLILAIFTKNISLLENLLTAKADPNITTMDDKLNALHVLVSLPACEAYLEILQLLLKYSADPNCRSGTQHWADQKLELLAQRELNEEDEGKTPLHLLCMRYDFASVSSEYLNQMVPILMKHGAKAKVRYLGHTPLSLAIIRGNIELIRTLLATKRINPNQQLGEEMGVPLTVLILKRYKNLLPDILTCQKIIDLLLEYKANPFDIVEDVGNTIEFILKEYQEPPKSKKPAKKKKKKTDKGNKKNKSKSKSSSSKKSKKSKNSQKGNNLTQEIIKKRLKSIAKEVLEKHIKGYAVKWLYFFVEAAEYYDNISENMAKFLTPEETIQIAQLLVHEGVIPIDVSTNYEVMHDLVEFVINVTQQSEDDEPPSTHVDIDSMLAFFDFTKIPKEKHVLNLPEPEIEKHTEKYNVCFHCYRKKNCQLYRCPECYLIYFCSQNCNSLNNKEKNPVHKCGVLFYNNEKDIHAERLERADLWKRTSDCRAKLLKIAEETGWVKKSSKEDFFACTGNVPPDPKRRLHLTREPGVQTRKNRITALQKLGLKSTSNLKVNAEYYKQGESVLSLRWLKVGSGFLTWPKKKKTETEKPRRKSGKYIEGASSSEREINQKRIGKSSKYQRKTSDESLDRKHRKKLPGEKLRSSSRTSTYEESDKAGLSKKHGKKFRSGSGGSDYDANISKLRHKGQKKESDDGGEEGKNLNLKKRGKADTIKDKGKKRSDSDETRDEGSNIKQRDTGSKGKSHKETEAHLETTTESRGVGKSETRRRSKVTGYDDRNQVGERGVERTKGRGRTLQQDTDSRDKNKKKTSGKPDKLEKFQTEGRGGGVIRTLQDDADISDKNKKTSGKPDELEKLQQPRLTGIGKYDDVTSLNKLAGYTPMPSDGKVLEFKRRLPNKYQYFLEKISEYWPEFDLSMLFLPYACYSNGQLYYRFLTNRPVFMETYSNI